MLGGMASGSRLPADVSDIRGWHSSSVACGTVLEVFQHYVPTASSVVPGTNDESNPIRLAFVLVNPWLMRMQWPSDDHATASG